MRQIQKHIASILFVTVFITSIVGFPLAVRATGSDPIPTADAGPDQVITLPTTRTTLSGSSLGFNGIVPPTYSWTKLSGSGTIGSPSSAMTDITGLTLGTSVFRLTVTDNVNTAIDEVSIIVNSGGIGGTGGVSVNAGPDQTIYWPNSNVTLSGSSSGISGIVIYYTWTIVSGSGNIISPNSATTDISNLTPGTSTFRLTATNNTGQTAFDDVNVFVIYNSPPPNIPPVAYAGPDQVITLPTNSIHIAGNGFDADGRIDSYSWTKLSGSGVANPANSDLTTIENLSQGTSIFRLTVTDDQGASGYDDVSIVVNATSGGGGGGTGGNGGSGSGGNTLCPVGTTGIYPNCIINTSNPNSIYFVNTAKLNIRTAPSVYSARVLSVKRRSLLEVLEGDRSSIWVKVKINTGQTGYVMTRYTQQLVKIGNKASITERLVNVRADESLRYKPLRTLKPTDIVDIIYVSPITSWVKVKSTDGRTGFVNKYLLKVVQ